MPNFSGNLSGCSVTLAVVYSLVHEDVRRAGVKLPTASGQALFYSKLIVLAFIRLQILVQSIT